MRLPKNWPEMGTGARQATEFRRGGGASHQIPHDGAHEDRRAKLKLAASGLTYLRPRAGNADQPIS